MARGRDNLPDRPASKDLRQLARAARFLAPYRGRIAVAVVALVVAALCVLALGQGLRLVIDRGFSHADASMLDRTLAGLLVVIVIQALATYARFYSVSWIGERVTADIRRAVFSHLLALSPGFFETTRTGEVISRLTNDTSLLEVVIETRDRPHLNETVSKLRTAGFEVEILTNPGGTR